MKKQFWMVYGEGQRAPEIKHGSLESARAEAKRLAGSYRGTRFFVLCAVGTAQSIDVAYEEIDEIPF